MSNYSNEYITFDWNITSASPLIRARPTYRADFDDKAEWEKFKTDHPLSSYAYMHTSNTYRLMYQRQAFDNYTANTAGRTPHWCGNGCGDIGANKLRGLTSLFCDACAALYKECGACTRMRTSLTTVEGTEYCLDCMDATFWRCAPCHVYVRRNDVAALAEHDHSRRTCTCEAQAQEFRIRNDGQPLLENDTRVTVQLPGGMIDAVGINLMAQRLYAMGFYTGSALVQRLDPQWQTKEGNFTKRLAKALYKEGSMEKLDPVMLSELGTIAADHSGKPMDMMVEVTRRLNGTPASMGNAASCWWGGFSYSRCTLKTLGGFGLRTFVEESRRDGRCVICGSGTFHRNICPRANGGGDIAGRAWVLPLRRGHGSSLVATRDAENCLAYVVFNAYGNLQGYTAPRLLAHMVGMSYKKLGFKVGNERMLVNSQSAYLVGSQELLNSRRSISLPKVADEHVNPYED